MSIELLEGLECIHAHLVRLEDVMDVKVRKLVKVEVEKEAPLRDSAFKSKISFAIDNLRTRAVGLNVMFPTKTAVDVTVSKCADGVKLKLRTISLESLLHSAQYSDGIKCYVYVYRALVDGKQLVSIKFRQMITNQTEKMVEKEVKGAVELAADPNTKPLFPELLFVLQLVSPAGRGNGTWWEGTCTTLLSDIEYTPLKPAIDYYAHYSNLLSRMHKAGYVHRDPHSGNFMEKKSSGNGIGHVYLIDTDRVTRLPTAPDMHHVSILLQILDYLELLFHGNPNCRFLSHLGDADVLDEVNQFIYDNDPRFYITCPPVGWITLHQLSPSQLKALLPHYTRIRYFIRNMPERGTYIDYLNSFTGADVDEHFNTIFSTETYMHDFDKVLRTIYDNPKFTLNPQAKP